jgi:hypothetical protein
MPARSEIQVRGRCTLNLVGKGHRDLGHAAKKHTTAGQGSCYPMSENPDMGHPDSVRELTSPASGPPAPCLNRNNAPRSSRYLILRHVLCRYNGMVRNAHPVRNWRTASSVEFAVQESHHMVKDEALCEDTWKSDEQAHVVLCSQDDPENQPHQDKMYCKGTGDDCPEPLRSPPTSEIRDHAPEGHHSDEYCGEPLVRRSDSHGDNCRDERNSNGNDLFPSACLGLGCPLILHSCKSPFQP